MSTEPTLERIPAVVLAAGRGTRMKTGAPKAAVRLNGRPMAAHIIESFRAAGTERIIAVVGHRATEVQDAIGNHVEYALQAEQLGTGHAAACAQPALDGYRGPVIVSYADIPLLGHGDLRELVSRHLEAGAAATMLTAVFEDPGTLGRIVRGTDGGVRGIVEARDATPEQLQIQEINVGVYCFDAPLVFEVLAEVGNDNAQKQYYLTDAIEILARRGDRVEAVALEHAHAGMGVDTLEHLSRAARLLRESGLRSHGGLRRVQAEAE